jgi:hypothetical protein
MHVFLVVCRPALARLESASTTMSDSAVRVVTDEWSVIAVLFKAFVASASSLPDAGKLLVI